ncbi:MAG: bifunctional folylpolyglutamate synthase/dihydrofolate synthase [Armatimonadetes bacterium]|nr:bifunctional folylpolyglutamate synthase/dihydrofolate synthase [Armatimonadota bacterium]
MSKLSFDDAVARLAAFQNRGWRLGTDRMQEFLNRLGLQDVLGQPGGPQFIHVAGTNGKGSVVAFLQSMLVEQGCRTGAMYSPYVYDVRERVQTGRDLIPKEDFARLTERLLEVGETLEDTEFGGPTEFEMKTALGFMYWAEQNIEWVALEVGLGGRLDATNVVDPAVSVITSIGLDHTQILGETLAEIAQEKAGIIKPGRPVVVGHVHRDALEAIEARAKDVGAPVWVFGREVTWEDGTVRTPGAEYAGLKPGLKGGVQAQNLSLAVAAIELAGAVCDKAAVKTGAEKTSLPGRYEVVDHEGRKFVLDGAHNKDAARFLLSIFQEQEGEKKVKLITGRTLGHATRPFYQAINPILAKAYVAKLDFHRTMDPADVIEEAGEALQGATMHDSASDALRKCLQETDPGDTILVTGSLYIVGEIGNLIRRSRS